MDAFLVLIGTVLPSRWPNCKHPVLVRVVRPDSVRSMTNALYSYRVLAMADDGESADRLIGESVGECNRIFPGSRYPVYAPTDISAALAAWHNVEESTNHEV